AKTRHRRQLFLGVAFALAMMLGAGSALIASYLKLRNAPQATSAVAVEPDEVPAPVAVVESSPSPTPIAEEQVAETTPPVTPKKEPKHRAVPEQPILDPI